MMILQSHREGPTIELLLIDDTRAAWVAKGARNRRARQAPAWRLTVVTEPIDYRPYSITAAGHATFGRATVHRMPRGAFWEWGAWDYRQQPYDPGWTSAGLVDPQTGEFRFGLDGVADERTRQFVDRLVTEDDRVALDTLLDVYLRGAPPDGVYGLDALIARRNPTRRNRRKSHV